MRKRISPVALLTTGLVCLAPSFTHAQSLDAIFRAGWSNAKMSGSNRLGGENKNGATAGAAVELQLNQDFGWEFGVAWVQKGGKGQITNIVNTSPGNPLPSEPQILINANARLNYLDFQMLPTIHLPTGDKAEFQFQVGVALGVLLSGKASGDIIIDNESQGPGEVDLKDGVNSIDWAGIAGAGFVFPFRQMDVHIDARVEIGFASIEDAGLDETLRTNAFLLTIGLGLPVAWD